VPRLLARLALADDSATEARWLRDPFSDPGWDETLIAVPAASWLDQLAGVTLQAGRHGGERVLRAGELLRRFPVALLRRADEGA
jgi:maltooligosyltrehalose synthase